MGWPEYQLPEGVKPEAVTVVKGITGHKVVKPRIRKSGRFYICSCINFSGKGRSVIAAYAAWEAAKEGD